MRRPGYLPSKRTPPRPLRSLPPDRAERETLLTPFKVLLVMIIGIWALVILSIVAVTR